MTGVLDKKPDHVARLATNPRYFRMFVENFNRDFHSELKARKRIPIILTRFNLKEYRRIDRIEDFASGLARHIYSRLDLSPLFLTLGKSKSGEEGAAIVKFLKGETDNFSKLTKEYLERRKRESKFSSSVANDFALSEHFFGSFEVALANTFEAIIYDQRKKEDTLRKQIEKSARYSPKFENDGKRIRITQQPADKGMSERKAIVRDRCSNLRKLCLLIQNQQPELKRLVEQYDSALRALRVDRGVYRVVLAGLDIQTFLKIKAELPPNDDDNLPLDSRTLGATNTLLIAHAGLINLYPDVDKIVAQLDRFQAQSKSLDALRDRVLDPVLQQLARSKGILDRPTLELTRSLNEVDEKEKALGTTPSQVVTSVKLAWLRGALAAMGRHVLDQAEHIGQIARDTAVKETVSVLIKSPTTLSASILTFVAAAQLPLLRVSDALSASFGWLRPFLSYVGLVP